MIAAGVAGYGIGKVIAADIDKSLSAYTGQKTTLGGWIYDKLHPEQAADAKAMTKPSPIGRAVQSTKPVEPVVPKMTVITDTKSAPASGSENKQSFITVDNKPVAINVSPPDSGNKSVSPPVSQQNTFSPTIHVTVNGDVKDPRQIAGEIMPHLKRMFEQEQSRLANGVMFDSAHAS